MATRFFKIAQKLIWLMLWPYRIDTDDFSPFLGWHVGSDDADATATLRPCFKTFYGCYLQLFVHLSLASLFQLTLFIVVEPGAYPKG
jgi:hypothetical protein